MVARADRALSTCSGRSAGRGQGFSSGTLHLQFVLSAGWKALPRLSPDFCLLYQRHGSRTIGLLVRARYCWIGASRPDLWSSGHGRGANVGVARHSRTHDPRDGSMAGEVLVESQVSFVLAANLLVHASLRGIRDRALLTRGH